MSQYTFAQYPEPEALRRIRCLAEHRARTGCFGFVHGGTDPEDDAIAWEATGLLPWTIECDEPVFEEVCLGLQGDSSLDVAFPEASFSEVVEMLESVSSVISMLDSVN